MFQNKRSEKLELLELPIPMEIEMNYVLIEVIDLFHSLVVWSGTLWFSSSWTVGMENI